MCTAATYLKDDFYFGRTFDFDFSYGEEVVVTPRNYPFTFRKTDDILSHYAIIGIAHVADDFPLYYEAINEKGLGIAGLNFAGNAVYHEIDESKTNIAPFEIVQYILSQCENVAQARALLEEMNIADISFSENLPASPLHWMIADKNEAITAESVSDGLKVYDNPVGVMTNNPPFDKQLFSLNNYRHISAACGENVFAKDIDLDEYSRGMGGLGLPGDLSSQSRFVRVAFTKLNSLSDSDEVSAVSQFFHILGSVLQPRGCCDLGAGKCEITIYTSCYNADKGIAYYTCYDNHTITAVDMNKEDLDGSEIKRYPLIQKNEIVYQNA